MTVIQIIHVALIGNYYLFINFEIILFSVKIIVTKIFVKLIFFLNIRFGSFDCKCLPGYGDRFAQDTERAGRFCESCSADYCSGRGSCYIEDGDLKVCECKGNFYGKRCELDGEVVAVAVGASVAAIVIILLTTFCLCIWR